jgi:AcrR family transcriptional regulator
MTQAQDASISRRIRKKERTRRQIQQVAIRLFSERGFDNVTIAEISEAADVDVTTFWRHFRTKYVLLYADEEAWLVEFRQALQAIPADMPPFMAGIQALLNTPPVGEPSLEELRAQIALQDPSPEVQAAILVFEDLAQQEMATVLAARMGVALETDPRPYIISDAIMAAAKWVRRYAIPKGGKDIDPKISLNLEAIIRSSLELITPEANKA